jgi:hypothetical protein
MTATMISAVSSRTVCSSPTLLSAFTAAGPVTAPASPAGALLAGAAIAAPDGYCRVAVDGARTGLPGDVHGERHGLAIGRRQERAGRGEPCHT